MTNITKPLHPYEQSMLLSAMLFDGKNLSELLNFFSDKQKERMHFAKEKFLKLPRTERVTRIVFELRRLLLIEEYRIDWIHKTWIEDALANEPIYLKKVIEEALLFGIKKTDDLTDIQQSWMPLPLVFSTFIEQIIKTPQKTAIYDPVLMRLQFLKDELQEEIFSLIGRYSINALGHVADRGKLSVFLMRRGFHEMPFFPISGYENPFKDQPLVYQFARTLSSLQKKSSLDCAVLSGLIMAALYLSHHKRQWQRTIALGLHQKFGGLLENLCHQLQKITLNEETKGALSGLLIASLDRVRR